MAIIFEDALKKNIQKENLLPVYFLCGNDDYLKKFYAQKIAKFISEEDDIFNYSKFGQETDLQEVYDFVMQMPLMADKKVAILFDYDFESAPKSEFEKLCDLISETPDYCTLILWFSNIEVDTKKSSKFKTLLKCAESAGGVVAKLDHRRTADLIKMLQDGALKRGCKLDYAAASFIVELVGDDINSLRNELNKLCAFTKSGVITKETVQQVSVKTVEASVFNLSKHILNCNSSSALSLLDELFFTKVEPMAIFYNISSIFTDMYRLFAAQENGENTKSVATLYQYKNKEFLLDKAAVNLKKFDRKKLNLCLEALFDADKKLKSFSLEQRIVLEQLIIKLIYICAKGEALD